MCTNTVDLGFHFIVIAVWAPQSLERSFAVPEASVMWQLRHLKVGLLMPGWADCFVYGMGQYVYTVWQPARHMCAPQLYVQQILMQWSTEWMWLTAGPKALWLLSDFISRWRCALGIQTLAAVDLQNNFLLYLKLKVNFTLIWIIILLCFLVISHLLSILNDKKTFKESVMFFLKIVFLYFPIAMLSSSNSAYTSLLAKTTCRDILMQNSHNSWQDLNDRLYF